MYLISTNVLAISGLLATMLRQRIRESFRIRIRIRWFLEGMFNRSKHFLLNYQLKDTSFNNKFLFASCQVSRNHFLSKKNMDLDPYYDFCLDADRYPITGTHKDFLGRQA